MKRYTFTRDSNGHWQHCESPDGEYYRRDDLIAAGCLVHVPDGEPEPLSEFGVGTIVELHGGLYRVDDFGDARSLIDDGIADINDDATVQPVRIVPLAELP